MNILPPVGIILLTYERTDYAVKTVHSIHDNLHYCGSMGWYLADDGSSSQHYGTVRENIVNYNELWGEHQTERRGYGYSANKAWQQLRDEWQSPITLWLEDDWILERPLDITPYVKMLVENHNNVGMVRLGHMPVDLELRSCGHDGHMYLNVSKGQQYTYSGNPHLKHLSFLEHYGILPEGKNPGETEIEYDYKVRSQEGPGIWWPLEIGDRPYFAHIGTEQSYDC